MHGLNRPIARPLAPTAPRRPKFSVQHGVELVDEYAWLRADNWQEVMRDPSVLDAEIRTYLEAENAYTAAALNDTLALQQTLYAEMKARIKEDDSSVPAADGPFEYFMSYVTGGQYPRLCRRPRGGGPEEILLDGPGRVRALLSCGGNPVAAFPDQLQTIDALRQSRLTAVRRSARGEHACPRRACCRGLRWRAS